VERGLYIAASGMLAAEVRQDVIANNLANATNAGFKGDKLVQESFGDLLLQQATSGATIGPLNTGTQVVQISPDLANQGFRWTQRSLDLAIGGDGWFTVQTPTGTAYTRDGAFTTNAQGQITTADGYAVLGVDGKPISVAGNGRIGVDSAGRVSVNGKAVGQLKVTDLQAASVRKLGGVSRSSPSAGAIIAKMDSDAPTGVPAYAALIWPMASKYAFRFVVITAVCRSSKYAPSAGSIAL